jgi:hypothetical protein
MLLNDIVVSHPTSSSAEHDGPSSVITLDVCQEPVSEIFEHDEMPGVIERTGAVIPALSSVFSVSDGPLSIQSIFPRPNEHVPKA